MNGNLPRKEIGSSDSEFLIRRSRLSTHLVIMIMIYACFKRKLHARTPAVSRYLVLKRGPVASNTGSVQIVSNCTCQCRSESIRTNLILNLLRSDLISIHTVA